MSVFGHDYAGAYDALYAEKDYRAECDLIEEAVRRFGPAGRGRLLDVGCGTGGHALELAARGTLDAPHHRTTVRYRVVETERDRVLSEAEEVHAMRYFFPEELRLLLEVSGFETLSISAFPSLDAPPADDNWNVFVVARSKSVSAATAI